MAQDLTKDDIKLVISVYSHAVGGPKNVRAYNARIAAEQGYATRDSVNMAIYRMKQKIERAANAGRLVEAPSHPIDFSTPAITRGGRKRKGDDTITEAQLRKRGRTNFVHRPSTTSTTLSDANVGSDSGSEDEPELDEANLAAKNRDDEVGETHDYRLIFPRSPSQHSNESHTELGDDAGHAVFCAQPGRPRTTFWTPIPSAAKARIIHVEEQARLKKLGLEGLSSLGQMYVKKVEAEGVVKSNHWAWKDFAGRWKMLQGVDLRMWLSD